MMRLDVALVGRKIAESRSRAQSLIKDGNVSVNGKTVSKPSFEVNDCDSIDCSFENTCPYVSRGGLKLEAALNEFDIDVKNAICLDIGASTGGFTDCLLKHGAEKIYAVDSGSSQLHSSLINNKRVISYENVNARYLDEKTIPEKVDIAVMDVSFISQTKLYASLCPLVKEGGIFISLIKPQFEVGRSGVGKGGIVKDRALREKSVKLIKEQAELYSFANIGIIESPIKGGDGNTEFLACFVKKS